MHFKGMCDHESLFVRLIFSYQESTGNIFKKALMIAHTLEVHGIRLREHPYNASSPCDIADIKRIKTNFDKVLQKTKESKDFKQPPPDATTPQIKI